MVIRKGGSEGARTGEDVRVAILAKVVRGASTSAAKFVVCVRLVVRLLYLKLKGLE